MGERIARQRRTIVTPVNHNERHALYLPGLHRFETAKALSSVTVLGKYAPSLFPQPRAAVVANPQIPDAACCLI